MIAVNDIALKSRPFMNDDKFAARHLVRRLLKCPCSHNPRMFVTNTLVYAYNNKTKLI